MAWIQLDLTHELQCDPHDLIIGAYLLRELSEPAGTELVAKLWAAVSGVLILVEAGTPTGFARIRLARDELIAGGARIVAPCPHQFACPMSKGDWCHFAERLPRSALHRSIKSAELAYEDEKFSYVAVSRFDASPVSARVIRHPQTRRGHVYLELCTPEGLKRELVSKRDGKYYREARDAKWGSALPLDGERRSR
jgi:ribosomal protein RSM22 (predicted rRNA methylase)